MSQYRLWIIWIIGSIYVSGLLSYWMFFSEDKTQFLPGDTSYAHYQIELKCSACHEEWGEVKQNACMDCHEQQMENIHDSHPKTKFNTPSTKKMLKKVDATRCVSCHQEHKPESTDHGNVSQPSDFCWHCHDNIAEERPSHEGVTFDSCSTAGCHNYHDNRALYEDFVAKHLDEPNLKEAPVVEAKEVYKKIVKIIQAPVFPGDVAVTEELMREWHDSAHAAAGVDCLQCHRTSEKDSTWVKKPNYQVCMECHEQEGQDFQMGHHGMRLAHELSPMTPGMSRSGLEFKRDAKHKELTCVSCHSSHEYDVQKAAVEACLKCHNDSHSKKFSQSKHNHLWLKEKGGTGLVNSGVSCATCHMPRVLKDVRGEEKIVVEHNQSANLRPHDIMARQVCMDCHGYEFSLKSLADEALIQRNFIGQPEVDLETFDWVRERNK